MVETHDYNPLFDKWYGKINLDKYFYKYHLQKSNDYLYAIIERISPSKDIILKRSGTFRIHISGVEKGKPFNFHYEKKVKFGVYNKSPAIKFLSLDFL